MYYVRFATEGDKRAYQVNYAQALTSITFSEL